MPAGTVRRCRAWADHAPCSGWASRSTREYFPSAGGWRLAGTQDLNSELIRLEGLTRVYAQGGLSVTALAGVSLVIQRGEYVAIMGPSGSGKSTLMNLIGLMDRPSAGSYRLNGIEVGALGSDEELSRIRGREIGFVFQNFNLLARQTAIENVELPLVYQGVSALERRERARRALERVGLSDREDHRPSELSGGQRQRVAVARALVTDPSLLLADEPTGNLDSRTGEDILALFRELHAQGNTLMVVTHDPTIASRAQRVIHLLDGHVERDVLNPATVDQN
ncbi:MAG: ABC transporter ATP-binding protein [Candidatus Delongbacteria bacterium]|nr:ABC transporter ATP-binding protein [Candidatus Cloacimonadota bacterium]MCB9473223.1 ABC transporter ATP-binding protein [Candidatus Delongbacteria bacterium]